MAFPYILPVPNVIGNGCLPYPRGQHWREGQVGTCTKRGGGGSVKQNREERGRSIFTSWSL